MSISFRNRTDTRATTYDVPLTANQHDDNILDLLNNGIQTYANVAALKAVDPSEWANNTVVYIKGHTSIADGGEGFLYWDSSSTDTDNNGTIFQATGVSTGRWIRPVSDSVHAKWFGGLSANLQDVLDYANTLGLANLGRGVNVYLGIGEYEIDTTLEMEHGVSIIGEGRHATRIKASSSFPTDTIFIKLGRDATSGVSMHTQIKHMTLDCQSISGSIGVWSDSINELSGLFDVLVKDAQAIGMVVYNNGVLGSAQNWTCRGVQLTMSDQIDGDSIGLMVLGNGSNTRGVDDVTVAVTGQTDTSALGTRAIVLYGASGEFSRIHTENMTTGIDISPTPSAWANATAYKAYSSVVESGGSYYVALESHTSDNADLPLSGSSKWGETSLPTAGLVISNFIGHITHTDGIRVGSNNGNQGITILGAKKANGTNIIQDNQKSLTLTDSSIGYYSIGNGNPTQVHSNSIDVVNRFNDDWDQGHIQLGSYHIWVDSTGDLRIKNGAPSSDTDGTIVGTQS